METEILQLFSSKKEMPARQTIPKDPGVFLRGTNPTIIPLWGWDRDYQTYFSERFGFLGLKAACYVVDGFTVRLSDFVDLMELRNGLFLMSQQGTLSCGDEEVADDFVYYIV